jgi:hypothetical protein
MAAQMVGMMSTYPTGNKLKIEKKLDKPVIQTVMI